MGHLKYSARPSMQNQLATCRINLVYMLLLGLHHAAWASTDSIHIYRFRNESCSIIHLLSSRDTIGQQYAVNVSYSVSRWCVYV